jgi:HEAT repeat protein
MSVENIDELFSVALTGNREDDAAWKAVTELHHLGTREILDRALTLTRSTEAQHRARGADILGQLGCLSKDPSKTFGPERLQALLLMLPEESDSEVLRAAIVALGHLGEPAGLHAILSFAKHSDEDVRYAVAWSLPRGLDDSEVIDTLLLLMRDSDSDVRDWATFGLGTQSDADSPLIRDALADRLHDADRDTREEAAAGLAKRRDLRVLPIVLDELAKDEYGVLYEEAASLLLGLNGTKPEGWESWRYVEELRARFNILDPPSDSSVQ